MFPCAHFSENKSHHINQIKNIKNIYIYCYCVRVYYLLLQEKIKFFLSKSHPLICREGRNLKRHKTQYITIYNYFPSVIYIMTSGVLIPYHTICAPGAVSDVEHSITKVGS